MQGPASETPQPATIASVDELEERLSDPSPAAIQALAGLEGDLIVLGVGGKMGPTLARMARRAGDAAGAQRRVIGVSRFTQPGLAERLAAHGIETVRCDLLDPEQIRRLPDASNVVAMTGMKFGATGRESLTWAMNTYLAGRICERYRQSRIVAFSTGNVYPFSPVALGGSLETDPPQPLGEYAMSTLGRERLYEHFSRTLGIPMAILRLNYATELRYGVLVDLARRVDAGQPIDLATGHFNAIWQADANAMALAALAHVAAPPLVFNVAGPEILSVRRVSEQFGRLLGKLPQWVGSESPDALLSNAQLSHRLFGYPRVSAGQMIDWIADWVRRGGENLDKPTHFETRDGKY